MGIINVGISDLNIARQPDVLATYALGSCVGVCLIDAVHNIGGLAHIMLPWSNEASNNVNYRRYADTGIIELIKLMRLNGASGSLAAKIAGGAQMFNGNLNTFNIGARNVSAVKSVLNDNNIQIIAEDTGENYGRTIFFDVKTGSLQVKSVTRKTIVI